MTAADRFAERSGAPVLTRMWWAVLLRGIAVLVFGLVSFFAFRDAAEIMARVFAAYAALDGILSIIGAKLAGGFSARRGLALAGLVSILAAMTAGAWAPMTVPVLVTIIGLWAVAKGVIEFAAALKLRQVMERDWSLTAIGGFSVAFGAFVLLQSQGGDLWTFIRVLAGYTLLMAALMFLLAWRFARGLRP